MTIRSVRTHACSDRARAEVWLDPKPAPALDAIAVKSGARIHLTDTRGKVVVLAVRLHVVHRSLSTDAREARTHLRGARRSGNRSPHLLRLDRSCARSRGAFSRVPRSVRSAHRGADGIAGVARRTARDADDQAIAAGIRRLVGERFLAVCADPNNLPFSNDKREGFEDALAALIAKEMDAELDYDWWPSRRGFLKNSLNAHRCDVVMGVPAGIDRVLLSPRTFDRRTSSSMDREHPTSTRSMRRRSVRFGSARRSSATKLRALRLSSRSRIADSPASSAAARCIATATSPGPRY